MMRALAASFIGTSLILLCAVAWLFLTPLAHAGGHICGQASWYGTESGNRTATGERFNGRSLTAAMPSRSMLGRSVRVTSLATGRSLIVRVNDLGPALWTHRIIDLSHASARTLGIAGVGRVCVSY